MGSDTKSPTRPETFEITFMIFWGKICEKSYSLLPKIDTPKIDAVSKNSRNFQIPKFFVEHFAEKRFKCPKKLINVSF